MTIRQSSEYDQGENRTGLGLFLLCDPGTKSPGIAINWDPRGCIFDVRWPAIELEADYSYQARISYVFVVG